MAITAEYSQETWGDFFAPTFKSSLNYKNNY